MSKGNFLGKTCLLLFIIFFSSCDTHIDMGDDTVNLNNNNPFVGTWVKDNTDDAVSVVLTNDTWQAIYESSVYNKGTYTCDGNTALWKITDKGKSSANVGDTGSATISNNKMTVSSFSDDDMNGQYKKQ